MNNRPPAALKALATELSGLLYTGSTDVNRINTLKDVFLTKTTDGDTGRQAILPDVDRPGQHIGIWKRSLKNGRLHYERDVQYHTEWHLWAGVQKLYAKSNNSRVVLLGESVARGYFYDPLYSVAAELEATLANVQALAGTEVVDLAKTSISMSGLEELLVTCTALEPDAVVIFAGNNWHTEFDQSLQPEDYLTMWSILQNGCFREIKLWLEDKFRLFVQEFLEKVNTHFIQKNIPVVFIIPAFNLKDWKSDEVEQVIPRLPAQQAVEWIQAADSATLASESGNCQQLEASGKKMIAVDPTNPLGFERLAEACLLQGKWKEAKSCFENARDATLISRGVNSKPRCFGVIKDAIRQSASIYGMHVIDADEVLSRYAANNLPGREQFLDYCHLTIDSIKLLMRYTAQALTEILTGKQVPVNNIHASLLHPGKPAEAVAHFCAAIHNAHYGQGAEILDYHCSKALSLSGTIVDLLLQYIDLATRRASSVFCRAFENIILSGKMKQYEGGFALGHSKDRKLMDIALVDAIARSLRSTGRDIVQNIAELRMQEHGVGKEGINLLEPFYSVTAYNDFALRITRAYMQVRAVKKSFYFVAGGSDSLLFTLVYRTSGELDPDRSVKIYLNNNDRPVKELPMSLSWNRAAFAITGGLIRAGVNQLTIEWPYTAQPFRTQNPVSADAVMTAMFPALGEIHAFSVQSVADHKQPVKRPALNNSFVR